MKTWFKSKKLLLSFIVLCYLIFPQLVLAVSWEVGFGNSIPHVWLGAQDYKYKGETIDIKPKLEHDTEAGSTYAASVLFDYIGIDYRLSYISYNVIIPAGDIADGEVAGFTRMLSQRYGVSLHIRGEVAGIFLGTGRSDNTESIEVADGFLEHSSSSSYLEYGLKLFFEVFALGFTHTQLPVGNHLIKTNTTQLIFYF